jgi:hypothetical protein
MEWKKVRQRCLRDVRLVDRISPHAVVVLTRWASLCLALISGAAIATDDTNVQSASLPELAAIAAYSDNAYIGGIDSRGVSLARTLADRLRSKLPGTDAPCPEPDAYDGEIVRAGADDTPIERPTLLADMLAAIEQASDEQRAVLLLALSWTGTKAAPLSGDLGSRRTYRDPWEVVALDSINCDRFSGGELDGLRPAPQLQSIKPAGADADDDPRLAWLLAHTLDVDRLWPYALIEGAQGDDRVRHSARLAIGPSDAQRIMAMLASPVPEARYKAAWLHLLAWRGARLDPLVPVVQEFAVGDDQRLAWAAQHVLLASDTRAGARQFVRFLDEDVLHHFWPETPTLAQRFPSEIIPALQRTLQSPTWSNRAAAIRWLGHTGSPRATPIVASAVRSVDWPSAMAAAAALSELKEHDPAARSLLEDLATNYWSGRVRAAARIGLTTGKPALSDPFECDAKPASGEQLPHSTADGSETECRIIVCFGACAVEHKLPVCGSSGPMNGRYRIDGTEAHHIAWVLPQRAAIPRVQISEVSPWCESVGITRVQRVEGGWLAGCMGFESEGSLVFIAATGDATPVEVAHMGVSVITRIGRRIIVAGSAPFEFGKAGALLEVVRGADGVWSTRPLAALPSVPDGYAVLGDRIAFRDEKNAVVYDLSGDIKPIEPAFECGPHGN